MQVRVYIDEALCQCALCNYSWLMMSSSAPAAASQCEWPRADLRAHLGVTWQAPEGMDPLEWERLMARMRGDYSHEVDTVEIYIGEGLCHIDESYIDEKNVCEECMTGICAMFVARRSVLHTALPDGDLTIRPLACGVGRDSRHRAIVSQASTFGFPGSKCGPRPFARPPFIQVLMGLRKFLSHRF